jgi:hypothetical protein
VILKYKINLGLLAEGISLNFSSRFPLQIRRKAIAQNLQRVFHFNRAASEQLYRVPHSFLGIYKSL